MLNSFAFFFVFRVTHLNHTALKHSPLLLSCDRDVASGPSRFKFLHAWLKHLDFLDVVLQSWVAPVVGSGMRAFQQKLVWLKLYLKVLNNDVFGNVFFLVQGGGEGCCSEKKGCMIFLVLLLTELSFLRLGPKCSTYCFVRRFFCISSLVFVGFERTMLIHASSIRLFKISASCFISIRLRMLPLSGFLSQLLLHFQ